MTTNFLTSRSQVNPTKAFADDKALFSLGGAVCPD